MQDKKYDDFFDEKDTAKTTEQQLMAMVDTIEKKTTEQELQSGTVVKGTVLNIGKDFIFVDVGQKNEAVIKKSELMDKDGVVTTKTGDIIEAFVISTENDEIIISKSLSGRKSGTRELIEAMHNKVPVEGRISGVNKGGFNVTVMGKKAFCPFSHMEIKFVAEPNTYLSKTLSFVITRVESRGKNIVLSRLPLLEKDLNIKIETLEQYCREKKVIQGAISKISDFGLFVDLDCVEGLVHISEISWDRAENLAEMYQIGQVVDCIILGIERKEPLRNTKVSLSIRMVGENPWTNISEKLPAGSTVEGTITRLTNFGAFVHLLPGVEGLIHISEMSWNKKVRNPADIVSIGNTVMVSILAVDEKKRTVSCSLKEITENPWSSITEKYSVGAKVVGTVASDTRYGFFIDLDEHFTGLLPHTKVAKEKKGSIKKGDKIEVDIEEIDQENQRISLSYGMEVPVVEVETVIQQKKEPPKKEVSEFGEMLRAAVQNKK